MTTVDPVVVKHMLRTKFNDFNKFEDGEDFGCVHTHTHTHTYTHTHTHTLYNTNNILTVFHMLIRLHRTRRRNIRASKDGKKS